MSSDAQNSWDIDFFVEDNGGFPVRAWLDGLPDEVRGKVIARIDLLKKGGPTLDYPYTSQIEGKLREARLRMGKTRYRILYFFDETRTAILLHGFTKNTATVEESDKRIGRSRMARHEVRLKTKKIGRARNSGQTKGKRRNENRLGQLSKTTAQKASRATGVRRGNKDSGHRASTRQFA